MTFVEVDPGVRGWWSEILAPYARIAGGTYIAALPDRAQSGAAAESPEAAHAAFWKGVADKSVFGEVKAYDFGPQHPDAIPAGSVDFVLVARAFHNWARQGDATHAYLRAFFTMLKPGGILAVEQHRAPEGADPRAGTGYVPESYVIEEARKVGFVLEAKSEINANPKDTRDHPFGVWTLPPTRRSAPAGQPDDPNFDTQNMMRSASPTGSLSGFASRIESRSYEAGGLAGLADELTFLQVVNRRHELTRSRQQFPTAFCADRRWDPTPNSIQSRVATKAVHPGQDERYELWRAHAARRPRGTCRHPEVGRLRSGPEPVSSTPLAIEPFLELDLRDAPGRVQVDPLSPRAPDATPASHERQILEERRFDRQDIKSSHVLRAVDTFEHENLKKGRIVRVRGNRQ